jgi:hypothetical protein
MLARLGPCRDSEVDAAGEQTMRLSQDKQIAIWDAWQQTPELTVAQLELLAIMRRGA